MKPFRFTFYYFFFIALFFLAMPIHAQKIDSDSLLITLISDMKASTNYQKNIEKCLLGKKIAPNYTDFQLLLGRNYELAKQTDSARFYYKTVIDTDPKYEDAFMYLINLDINEKKYDEALDYIEIAINHYPESYVYYQKKIEIHEIENHPRKIINSLQELINKFPNDTKSKQKLEQLEKNRLDHRIGINYMYTYIDREEIGPWHLTSVEYLNEQKWGTLISRINYANRFAVNNTIDKGLQYEIEGYKPMGKKNYAHINATFSDAIVFPKIRLGGSFYLNLNKTWDSEIGIRYIKTENLDIITMVLGGSKHVGNYLFILKAYLNNSQKKHNPVVTFSSRYYLDSKFDYISGSLGFGTSPDERTTLGQLQSRINLNSFRMGAGYYRILKKQFITGIQFNYNHQEYLTNAYQNEYELSLLLHYKL